jgi:hypothetical protein
MVNVLHPEANDSPAQWPCWSIVQNSEPICIISPHILMSLAAGSMYHACEGHLMHLSVPVSLVPIKPQCDL